MPIKDSGKRREFSTGAVRDIQEGVKGRCDLLPIDIVADLLIDDGLDLNVMTCINKFLQDGCVSHLYKAFQNFCYLRGWDTVTALLELSVHFEEGAKKYNENNWKKGIPVHSYIDSAIRHFLKFLRGDNDEPHDRAFLWNIVCCIWTVQHKPEMNDLPKEQE